VERLVDEGANVVCLMRGQVSRCELVSTRLVEREKIVCGDLRDRSDGQYRRDYLYVEDG